MRQLQMGTLNHPYHPLPVPQPGLSRLIGPPAASSGVCSFSPFAESSPLVPLLHRVQILVEISYLLVSQTALNLDFYTSPLRLLSL